MTEIILNDLQFCVLCVFCSDCLLFQCFIQEMIPQLSLNEIFQPTNVETNKEISAQWGGEVISVMIITILVSEKRKCYEKYLDNIIS